MEDNPQALIPAASQAIIPAAPAPLPPSFTKVCRIGTIPTWGGGRMSVYITIKWDAKQGRLSFTGVEGPRQSGNCTGGFGQIGMNYAHRNPADNDPRTRRLIRPADIRFAPGWRAGLWLDLLDAWQRWHLNDMRPGCVHQMLEGWDKRRLDPTKDIGATITLPGGKATSNGNRAGWVYPAEHPNGLLTKPCPVCGYKYGSAWLREDVPAEVLERIRNLPDADRRPAWH